MLETIEEISKSGKDGSKLEIWEGIAQFFTFEKGFFKCIFHDRKMTFLNETWCNCVFLTEDLESLIGKESLMEDECFDEKVREVLEVQRRRN